MRKLLIILFVLPCVMSYGMIDPFYKEVMQRGYDILPGDSVRFPDGSVCAIQEFNDQLCGQKWMTEDYCIPEGRPVWDDDRCCDGLAPYLPAGNDGQETCQKIKKESENEEEGVISSFLGSKTVLYFFLGVLIPLGLFVILAISIKRKLPKKED